MAEEMQLKDAVAAYWNREPCGSKHARSEPGSPAFFREVEDSRASLEPFIDRFAGFDAAGGQEVLEIGMGLGTDLVRFARAGARVSGVDLTPRAIELARRRLAHEGLDGDLRVADAEDLPFDDASFDVVYSWGVLHHTPDTARAVAEALRVLRPGGRFCIMLYARRSWFALAVWGRQALLRGRPWRRVAAVLSEHLESPGTKAFTPGEFKRMIGSRSGDLAIQHVATPYDRRLVGRLADRTGSSLGWFLVATGKRA